MTSISTVEQSIQPNYSAVKIKINRPMAEIENRNNAQNGIYNAVDLEINEPSMYTITQPLYSYPEYNKAVTSEYANIQSTSKPIVPNAIVAYENNIDTPRPNITTIDNEKKISFRAVEPEVVPPVEIKPDIDINLVIDNLSSENFDKQAQQMEEIAKMAMNESERATQFLVADVFNKLTDIVKLNSSNLEKPTDRQIEIRKQIIINELVREEALKNGEDNDKISVPFQISKEEMISAADLSEMEQAERNKEYSLYTMAILTKLYIDEIEKHTGKIVPLTDLPAVSTMIEILRYNENPSVKVAAIDALRYIKRDEYKDELSSVFSIVSNNEDPYIANSAKLALESLN